MRRYIISGIVITFVVGLVFYGCPKEEEKPPTPSVTATVDDGGGSITYTWNIIDEADGYRVYVDGVLEKELDVSTTTYTVEGPAQEVEIVSYSGDEESDPVTFDYTPVQSMGTIYERSDTISGHYSAYGWDASNGNGTEYALSNSNDWPLIDFYLDDFTAGQINPSDMYFVSPDYNAFGDPFNNRRAWFATGTGDIAPAVGEENYSTPRTEYAVASQTYFFWLDRNASDTWDTGDYFVKVVVSNVGSDGSVDFTCYFQKTGGLRWLKTK